MIQKANPKFLTQVQYAERNRIPHIVIIGEGELAEEEPPEAQQVFDTPPRSSRVSPGWPFLLSRFRRAGTAVGEN